MSLVVGLMLTTFLFLFGFVISIGMLVNAKINLQNAADLAAYAGAATQARQLTHISYLNYEMRRQYKKFLYRYYVVGTNAFKDFPRAGGSGNQVWGFPPSNVFPAPTICLIFDQNDNFCQLKDIKPISIAPAMPLDPVSVVTAKNLEEAEKYRKSQCSRIGKQNTMLLQLWLFNPDPYLLRLPDAFKTLPTTVAQHMINALKGATSGLGLVPKLLTLRMRIETLKGYVNSLPVSGMTRTAVDGLQATSDPPAKERTIQAFLSAYNTLGPNVFDPGSITMDELLPPGGSGEAKLLELKDIKSDTMVTYSMDLGPEPGKEDDPSASCIGTPVATILKSGLTLGVYKDPSVLTYYAVRLKAKARILFWGEVEMTAVAAAQPFGSRLGPPLSDRDFAIATGPPDPRLLAKNPGAVGNDEQADVIAIGNGLVPNLPVGESDTAQIGWNNRSVLSSFYEYTTRGLTDPRIRSAYIDRGVRGAMAPNPWEKGKYNIPTDFPDPFTVSFDAKSQLAIWAPVVPPDKTSQLKDIIHTAVADYLSGTGTKSTSITGSNSGPGGGGGQNQNFRTILLAELERYLSSDLQNGMGETSDAPGGMPETFKIARISNPLRAIPQPGETTPPLLTLQNNVIMTKVEEIKTSFNTLLNPDFLAQGRTGYSVKLVAFDHLLNGKMNASNFGSGSVIGDAPLSNFPPVGLEPALPAVKH